MRKIGYLIFLSALIVGGNTANAQVSILTKYQDTLVTIAKNTQLANDDTKRIESNSAFVKTLVNALKIPFSYNFPFDSVKSVSVVQSPDKHFRIFSWFLTMSDGTFRYYGAIQLPTASGKLQLIPLSDQTDKIVDVNEMLSASRWLGARYYEILPVASPSKPTYFVLLGWKGRNNMLSERVIEILSFTNEIPVFGKPVFDGPKGTVAKNRVIFSYNKFNSMLLKYDKTVNMLVFDHLAPIDPSKKDDPTFYASDSSFDAYKFVNGRLKFMENVELLNPPDAADDLYNDPKSFKPLVIN